MRQYLRRGKLGSWLMAFCESLDPRDQVNSGRRWGERACGSSGMEEESKPCVACPVGERESKSPVGVREHHVKWKLTFVDTVAWH